jgi:hypothetical protein
MWVSPLVATFLMLALPLGACGRDGVGHVKRITAEHDAEPSAGERPSLWRRLFGRG